MQIALFFLVFPYSMPILDIDYFAFLFIVFMNTLSRVLLTILAILGVSALGYYAFRLSSQTLTLPFIGSEKQTGERMEIVLSPPSLSLGVSSDAIVDREALMAALVHEEGETTQPVLSGEYSVDMN